MSSRGALKKIEDAKKRIEDGDRSGSCEFDTAKELCEYIGIGYRTLQLYRRKVDQAGFLIKNISIPIKIEDAKKRIDDGERDGSLEFDTVGKLCEYIGISERGFRDNKEMVEQAGFTFDGRAIPRKIEIAKKRIEDGDRDGSFEFSTLKEVCEYIGVNDGGTSLSREIAVQAGFNIRYGSIPQKIEDAKKRIEDGDRNGNFEFDTIVEICEYVGVQKYRFFDHKEKFMSAGFRYGGDVITRKIEDAKKRIEDGDRDGNFEFDTIKSLCEYIDVTKAKCMAAREKIDQAGFLVKPRSVTQKKIEDAKKRINEGERDSSFKFESAVKLFGFIGMSESAFRNNKEAIEEAGFIIKNSSSSKKIEDAKKRIEDGDRNGNFEFDTITELCKFVGIGKSTHKTCKEELRQAGFRTVQRQISKNIQVAIRECVAHDIKLENAELLPAISKEFFSKHIRPPEYIGGYAAIAADIVHSYGLEEKRNAVSEAVLKLISEDRGDYSMLELKLELFVKGIYLSEESLSEALMMLGEDIDREDSMGRRLRLSESFVNNGLAEIEYVDNLPLINNSASGNILLSKQVRNKKMFIKLWREYVLYSIQNKITGTVSKTKIPDDWDGSLDSLFALIPAYEKAYLLDKDSIWFLEEVGYEGILAICQFGSKQSKEELTRMHHSIHARCIGFFLFLNRKKYALMQPKYIIFTGAKSVSDTARTIMGNHVVMCGYRQVLKMDDAPQIELKKLSQKGVELQALKLSSAVLEGCALELIRSKDIYAYMEHNSHEAVSGTIIHETFVLTVLRLLGNLGAIEKPKSFDFEAEVLSSKLASGVKTKTFRNYKKLLKEMLDVVKRQLDNGYTHGLIRNYLKHIFVLMRFLDTFPEKLNRKEMSTVLNTIIVSGVEKSFTRWKNGNLSDKQYADFTNRMYVIFDNISIEEYRGLYNKGWKVAHKAIGKTLIREGMNSEIFSILQHVAIYDPPRADEYPFIKTTPQGEQLDLSWWPYDFSPIPVICNWLIIKTTRRKVNIRQLDVRTFLRFDGDQLTHIHFNTDKNRESKERDISIHLLRYLFDPQELELLKKYVEYIGSAYSSMTPVDYESTTKHYGGIMPLFPHHSKNAVIADHWIDGYHVKTMLKTEHILKSSIKKGVFDSFIEEQDRERRKEDLATMQLVFRMPSKNRKIPSSLDELDSVSLTGYQRLFTTVYGVHNMRHAGISALGAQLPLVYVRMIAGHSDINTTARVYFHADEEIIGNEILRGEAVSLNEPIGTSSKFIRRRIMPVIESGEPEKIEKILKENLFMSASREIQDGPEVKLVKDGIARVAMLHPSLWIPQKHGICGNNQQCPAGTNGCCALCPFNIFSPLHIKGVMYELNTCMEEITLMSQKVALDSRVNINATREELKDAHQQKIRELAAWFEVLDMATGEISELNDGEAEKLPKTIGERLKKELYSVGACSVDEATMELLVDASELKIDNLDTDNRISKMSHRFMQAAIRRKDYDYLDRMANEGIQYIVDEYGKKAVEGRREFLLKQLRAGPLLGNTVSLDADNSSAGLLPVR